MMTDADKPFVLLGLGEVLWDLLPGGKQLGGAPANFAYHACALGGRGVVASCVGDDDLGREILAKLDALQVDRSAVATDGEHPTGTVSIDVDDQGRPNYTIHEGVAWDFIPAGADLLATAARADAMYFGSVAQRAPVSRRTIRRCLAAARGDCLRIYDINLRQSYYSREIVDRTLALSDVLKLNEEELVVVAEMLSISGSQDDVQAELLRRYSLRLVVLTRGEGGSVIRSADRTSVCPGQKVRVVDTVGAGDAFTAAVAVGLLGGEDLDTVHRHAARVAAFVCTRAGATPDVPLELRQF